MVDPRQEFPVAFTITPTNIHDSQQFNTLYQKVKTYDARFPIRFFIGDKAFDTRSIRQLLLKDHATPIIKAARSPIRAHYSKWFKEKYVKRVSVERLFSRFKEFLDLKKLRIYGLQSLQFYTTILLTAMVLVGYMNYKLGHSPRSIKTFKRLYL